MIAAVMTTAFAGTVKADTYEQLTSIANIDESAEYVLGIDGTGFHYEGTSSWGNTALPSAQTPIKYTLTKASDGNSFTAQATISGTTYYLQIPTSNTFSMATTAGTNTDIIIGTTQVSGTNYAVANKTTTARHLRINGTSGLRSYAGTTGTMAFFYKIVATPVYTITAQSNNTIYGTVSLSGNVITATPASGYRISTSTPYSVSPANSATVSQNGKVFTVTPSANTTVTINFEAMPTVSGYTIDFENDIDEYVDWTFESIGTSNTTITAHGGSKYGANINTAGNGVGTCSIQTNDPIALPGTFTCYVSKVSTNTTASTWTLAVSSDGSNWTEVATQAAQSMSKGEWVEFTSNLSGYSDVYVRLSYGGSTAIRAIDDISITMRDPNAKITPTVTVDASGLTTNDVAGSINVAAGTLTASVTSGEITITTPAVTWSSSDTSVATVNATTGAVTLIAAGTTTITATFAGNDDYTEATDTYELTVIDSYAKGGLNNPYTVAEAIEAYDAAGANIEGVYVTGIVCTASSYLYNNKYLSYYISDDGTTNSSQLEAYNGLGKNGANFTSVNDVLVGDVVVIYGTLTYYASGSKYELAANNHLVSLEREKTNPTILVEDATIAFGETYTIDSELIEGGAVSVSVSPEGFATVTGMTITPSKAGSATVTVSTAENSNYNAGSKTFTLTVTQPAGQTTEPTAVGGTIFYESFDGFVKNSSNATTQGGNDNGQETGNDLWSGNAGATQFSTVSSYCDESGWTVTSGGAGYQCAKFGAGSSLGSATTPTIAFNDAATTYTLTFKAGAWANDKTEDGLVLSCSDENATLSQTTFTLTNASWSNYSVTITGVGNGATITFSAVQASKNRFFLDEVKVEAPTSAYTESYTIPSSGLGTYCSQYPIDLDELPEGVKAYAVESQTESSVALTQLTGTIKGGTGFILEGSGEVTFTFADSSTEPTNLLKGTLAPEYLAAGTAYGLSGGKFHPNNAGTIPAHKAYLPADAAGNAVKALTLIFEDDATGITHTRVITDETTIYDLTGRRLSKTQKGINIVNGKKILK